MGRHVFRNCLTDKMEGIQGTGSPRTCILLYAVNHKKGTLFILGITWPNVDQTLQYLAEL